MPSQGEHVVGGGGECEGANQSILSLYMTMSLGFSSSSQGYENVPMYIKVRVGG